MTNKTSTAIYNYLGKRKEDLVKELGMPEKYSNHTMFYSRRFFFFRDEILFSIQDGKVTEIGVTEYFIGIPLTDIIYRKSGTPSYSNVDLITSKVFQY